MTPKRDQTLDVFKGWLVILMVFCHVLQFFGDAQLFPVEGTIETLINLTVFPGFVFAFGIAVTLAYLDRPYRKAWPRMLRSALRSLGAFYLSGIAFRVLRENKPFAVGTVRRILLLEDIPGWSEFLAAFAIFGVVALLLFIPLRWLKQRPLVAAGISLLCLFGCFLPYDAITSPQLGLLIGTRETVTFPVLQYAPYFLMGIAFPLRDKRRTWIWGAGAALCTGVGACLWWRQGALPERFPPSIGWILLPAAACALLWLLSWAVCRIPLGRFARVSPLIPVASMGRSSLYYLLASNLVLFTCAGKNLAPWLKTGAKGLWGTPIQSPLGAVYWTFLLLLACGFVASLVTKPARQIPAKEPSA